MTPSIYFIFHQQLTTQPFNVRFRNDYRPVFNSSTPQTINIYENATAPKTLHTFVATDQDTGIAGNVVYATGDSTLAWLFSLSASTGLFRLSKTLDRENVSSYSLVIRASDSAPSPFELTSDLQLRINVLDVNDNKPEYHWHVLNITVPETVPVGRPAFNVTTRDADEGENGRITYQVLSTNGTGKFQLNSSSGVFIALGELFWLIRRLVLFMMFLVVINKGAFCNNSEIDILISMGDYL